MSISQATPLPKRNTRPGPQVSKDGLSILLSVLGRASCSPESLSAKCRCPVLSIARSALTAAATYATCERLVVLTKAQKKAQKAEAKAKAKEKEKAKATERERRKHRTPEERAKIQAENLARRQEAERVEEIGWLYHGELDEKED
jgi:IS5 family transposase